MPWAHARSADTEIPTIHPTGGTPLLDEKAYASLMAKCWRCQAAEPVHPMACGPEPAKPRPTFSTDESYLNYEGYASR